ncbi:hypothetical protein A79_5035 [Vibrio parahaemolyticus AQ3810]|nr:hypothetical protein A79_5035 [Vibrio parahaemolyticus AQ3810]
MNLSFRLQASKCRRVQDSRSITLIGAAVVITADFMLIIVALLPQRV